MDARIPRKSHFGEEITVMILARTRTLQIDIPHFWNISWLFVFQICFKFLYIVGEQDRLL
jgi:hypothetical protein